MTRQPSEPPIDPLARPRPTDPHAPRVATVAVEEVALVAVIDTRADAGARHPAGDAHRGASERDVAPEGFLATHGESGPGWLGTLEQRRHRAGSEGWADSMNRRVMAERRGRVAYREPAIGRRTP